MGKPLPYDIRVKIVSRRQQGQPYGEIAESLGCSVGGVKKIWRQYNLQGEAAFQPDYSRCGRPSPYDEVIRDKADRLRDHRQGGEYIHSKLLIACPGEVVPSARTLQRWWVVQGTARGRGRVEEREKKVE